MSEFSSVVRVLHLTAGYSFLALLFPNPSGFNKLESEFLKAETITRLAMYFMASVSVISRTRKRLHYVRILILCFEI